MRIFKHERNDNELNEQRESEYWAKRQSICDHEYEPITNEGDFDDYEIVSFDCECIVCGKRAKEVYTFSHYQEE